MELQGKIIRIEETDQHTDSFRSRTIIIEHGDNPQYVSPVSLVSTQDKVSLFDNLRTGDEKTFHINVRGREAKNGNVYNQLVVWKIS